MTNTIDPDVSAQQQFLVQNFGRLAVVAWTVYQQNGRGAVLLTGDVPTAANPAPPACTMRYATDPAVVGENARRAVTEYDPVTQVVCIVVRPSGTSEAERRDRHWMTSPQGPVPDVCARALANGEAAPA